MRHTTFAEYAVYIDLQTRSWGKREIIVRSVLSRDHNRDPAIKWDTLPDVGR